MTMKCHDRDPPSRAVFSSHCDSTLRTKPACGNHGDGEVFLQRNPLRVPLVVVVVKHSDPHEDAINWPNLWIFILKMISLGSTASL